MMSGQTPAPSSAVATASPESERPTAARRADPVPPGDVCLLVGHLGAGTVTAQLARAQSVVVGRDPAAAGLVLADDSVSRVHAEFAFQERGLLVRDLQSSNGTLLRGRRVVDWELVTAGEPVEIGCAVVVAAFPRPRASRVRLYAGGGFEARVAEELARGRAYRRPCSVAVIRVPDVALAAALRVVLGRVRGMDAVTVYGPREIALLLVELDLAGAVAIVSSLCERVAAAAPGVRAGLARFPEDGGSPEDLLGAAAAAAVAGVAHGPFVSASPGRAAPDESEPVAASEAMRHVLELARRVAPTELPVLLLGETGVGKDVVARRIHRLSGRTGPFVHVNCAGLPEQLLESELFGHVRGSFTGAIADRKGVFEQASGGTVFLDEIGDASRGVQVRLLRVLEARQVVPVGSAEEHPVDARVIAATNRDLQREAEGGSFRKDLWYRLGGCIIPVPPLRSRPLDVEPLAEASLAAATRRDGSPRRLSVEARLALGAHHWPGNVRELRHVIERAVALSEGPEITLEHLPESIRVAAVRAALPPALPAPEPAVERPPMRATVEVVERIEILRALEQAGQNRTQAAALLGISRRTLYEKIARYGIGRAS